MTAVYSALVHFPVRSRDGGELCSAITNLDVHDIARSSTTYGLTGFYVVTPIDAQRALLDRILEHWDAGAGRDRTPERSEALSICRGAASVEDVVEAIASEHGRPPRVIATAARSDAGREVTTFQAERRSLVADATPRLILFGTAHGLADSVLAKCDALLEPITGTGRYNHLSVRAAAAIVFDRLLSPERAGI